MRYRRLDTLVLAFALTVGLDQIAAAQTVVQLPSFSRFTYSGSVLVPTGGSTSLGSVSRTSSSRSSRGFGGRASGAGMSHAGARAHVTIIDNDAIDRQLRGLPPYETASRSSGQQSRGLAVGQTQRPRRSTEIAHVNRRPARNNDPDAEGKALVRFARKQYLGGQRSSSFDAYRLAIETLSPKLSELARAEFQRVFPAKQRPINTRSNRFAASRPVD